jgi:hypothetical protein
MEAEVFWKLLINVYQAYEITQQKFSLHNPTLNLKSHSSFYGFIVYEKWSCKQDYENFV